MLNSKATWQQQLHRTDWPGFQFIFFDCDSTLSTIEGIDELARQKGQFEHIKQLTDAAMEGEVHLQSIYDRRLELLSPTRAEIRQIERLYRQHIVPEAVEVIQALHGTGKELFIVSGGLLAAVQPFGQWLGIPARNIRAVDVYYNRLSGRWWDYQQDRWGYRPDVEYIDLEETPLVESHGKAQVIRELLPDRAGRALLIGDGVSDLAARPAVDLVVGFGGVVTRPRVAAEAEIFIHCPSLAPLLPLALAAKEQANLPPAHAAAFNRGLACIESGQVTFRSHQRR